MSTARCMSSQFSEYSKASDPSPRMGTRAIIVAPNLALFAFSSGGYASGDFRLVLGGLELF